MPSRSADAERPAEHTDLHGASITLAACFAWLGWRRPTCGLGAGAARPWRPELISLLSRLRLPLPAFAQRKRAVVIEFPGSPSPDPPAASVIPRLRAA